MSEIELQRCTRRQLLALARQAQIRGRHRMRKDEIIAALRSHATAPPRRRPKRTARPESGAPAPLEVASPAAIDAIPATGGAQLPGGREPVLLGQQEPELKELTELPASYGHTRLTLMEIDPYRIHAYWEVTPRDYEATLARLGPERTAAHWVVRFYDVTSIDFDGTNAHGYFDQPIDLSAGNWYVNLWSSGRSYCADIGALAPSGRFEPTCRSNFAHTQPADASPHYQPEWLHVESNFDTQAAAPTLTAASVNSEGPPSARPSPPPVTEADVRQYYDELFPASTATAAREHDEPGEPPPSTAATGPADAPLAAQARGATPMPAAPLSATGEAAPLSARRAARLPDTVSSFGSGGWAPARQAGIDLKLNAEVIISGRAQPGQAIQVNGQWLKVNADGTFSVRLALPTRT